jgi:hypothetical protein
MPEVGGRGGPRENGRCGLPSTAASSNGAGTRMLVEEPELDAAKCRVALSSRVREYLRWTGGRSNSGLFRRTMCRVVRGRRWGRGGLPAQWFISGNEPFGSRPEPGANLMVSNLRSPPGEAPEGRAGAALQPMC